MVKTTGLVRRIDELGRIVIPKDIRKALRLKDGESVEIFLENDNILLKKYSPLENLNVFYENYVSSLHSSLGKNVFIIDRDKIVASSGDLKKKYLNVNISSKMDEIVQNRDILIKNEKDKIFLGDNLVEEGYYVVAPIIVNGDAIGAVIILSLDKVLEEIDIKTITIAATFLGKYIE